jgi:NitT/TauT family transport system substrate-binding protein
MLSPDKVASLGRRKLLTAGAAGAAATLISGCNIDKPRPATSGNVEEVTYVTGFNITGQDSFVFAAIDKGWYGEAGLEVKVVPGVGTRGNLQRLREGHAQFAVIDITGALLEINNAVNSGTFADFRVFATIYQQTVSCIVALPAANIHTPADLAGKRIGYSEGGVNRTIFPAYARLAGQDEATVKWVSLPPPSIRAALIAGQLDAATEIVVGRPAVEAARHHRQLARAATRPGPADRRLRRGHRLLATHPRRHPTRHRPRRNHP